MTPAETEEVAQLRKELAVTDEILAEYRRVMDAIPPCPAHGQGCVPHAIAWVKERKKEEDDREAAGRYVSGWSRWPA